MSESRHWAAEIVAKHVHCEGSCDCPEVADRLVEMARESAAAVINFMAAIDPVITQRGVEMADDAEAWLRERTAG